MTNGNRIRPPVIIGIPRIGSHERYHSVYPYRLSEKKKSELSVLLYEKLRLKNVKEIGLCLIQGGYYRVHFKKTFSGVFARLGISRKRVVCGARC